VAPSGDAPAAAAGASDVTAPASAAAEHIRVRLFAAYRDAAGRAELALPLGAAGATVGDVWRRLVADHPALAALPPAAAVNAVLVRFDAPVVAGDEVAFLPPVSGG